RARAARIPLHEDFHPTVLVPTERLPTRRARAVLPEVVAHRDAAFNAGRAGLLVLALSSRPDLLLPATEDRLHQSQRADSMMASVALVQRLREADAPAVISGAGPTVLVLSPLSQEQRELVGPGWQVRATPVDTAGGRIDTTVGVA